MTSHGIFSARIVDKYKLGLVTEPVFSDDEKFRGMLSIPYLSRGGVKALKFRNLGDGKPKYAQHAGQGGARLYNTNAYFEAEDTIGIAEGEPDAIAATECLGIPTIGVPGAEMWTKHKGIWAPIFRNFARVLVFTDGDPVNKQTGLRPGEELGKAITGSLGWRARVIDSPEGEDVSSMVAAGRADELKARFAEIDDEEEYESRAA